MKQCPIFLKIVLLAGAAAPALCVTAQSAATSAASIIAGQYAFFLTGQEQAPGGMTELIGIAGSVNTDGKGNITSGILDKNSATGYVATQQVSGTYQLDSTGKGAFNIVTPGGTIGFTFYTGLPLAAGGTTGTIVAGAGTVLQASGSVGPAQSPFLPIDSGEYEAFAASGETGAGTGSFVESGTLNFIPAASSPAGTASGSVTASITKVTNGTASTLSGLIGTYTGPYQLGANGVAVPGPGRFTMMLPVAPGSSTMAHYVVYQGLFANGSYFLLSTDAHPASLIVASTSVTTQNYLAGLPN